MAEDQPVIAESQHYPEVIARRAHQSELVAEGTENFLASPEGYLELEHEARELQQALALDFDIWASDLPEDKLKEMAEPHLEAMNAQRPGEPVTLEGMNRVFLQHLIRPKWHEHLPTDTSETETETWHSFLGQWPDHLQANLEELAAVDVELRSLATDETLMQEVQGMRTERIEVMRAASDYLGAGRMLDKLAAQAVAIRAQAAISNRPLTKRERTRIEMIGQHQASARERQNSALTSEEVVKEVAKRQALKDARDLRKGLLLTEQMQDSIDYVLPSLMAGKPVLLVGETGGAKTALAEFISKEYMGEEPELISGHAEVNSYQLVGKMSLATEGGELSSDAINTVMDQLVAAGGEDFDELTPESRTQLRITAMWLLANKATVSEFMPGPMLRAMEEGKPIILDEINAMPADFLKRLNKVLQLRPGDTYTPQEDSGRSVKIKPGFCIIATANEKSKRYKGVDDLSVELLNRFGANVVRIGYPDATVPDGQPPKDNLRLALAFLRDRNGELDPDIDLTEIGKFVRAAHVTQKLFTGSDVPDYVDPDTVRDGLKDAVIAPRTMIDILSKVKEGHEMPAILAHFVSGFKNQSDQKALKIILEHNGFDLGSRRIPVQ